MPLSQRLSLAIRMAVGGFPTAPGGSIASPITSVVKGEAPQRSAEEFLKAYSTMPWLRATTHRIAEGVAATRWRVLAVRRGGRFRMTNLADASREERVKSIKRLKQEGELIEIEDTPLNRLLHTGNDQLTGGEIRRITQVYIDIIGEAFWFKERNAVGVPEVVWPLPPTWIKRTPTNSVPTFEVSYRGYHRIVPVEDMLWFRDPNPVNPYGRGAGVAQALADELEIDEFSAKYVKNWFFNSAIPPIVVSPRQDSSHNTWSATQRTSLEQSWNDRHQGYWKAFKALFSPVPIEVQELSHSFREQALGDLRRQQRDTIVQILGIPPEIVGINETSNRATIDAAQLIFAEQVLIPRLEHLRETMQLRLVPEYDDRLVLDYEDPTPSNEEFRLKAYRAHPQAATENEWRELMGLEAVDHGEVHYVPNNTMPTSSLSDSPAPRGQGATGMQPPSRAMRSLADGRREKAPLFVDEFADDEFYMMIHRVADRLTLSYARRFREIIDSARQNIDDNILAAAFRSHSVAGVEDALPWNDVVEALREASHEAVSQTLVSAGNCAASELADNFGISVGFNEASPTVAQFSRSQSALLVARIDESSRRAIRDAVTRAFEQNRTYAQVAQEIRAKIGLLPTQEAKIERFRLQLLDQGRSESEIVRRIERLSSSMLRERSLTIARTELIDAANEGQQLLWRQASEVGQLDTERARRHWIVTPDDRLDTQLCEPVPSLNPNGVSLYEPFTTPAGPKMRPTMHPKCRCALSLRFVD